MYCKNDGELIYSYYCKYYSQGVTHYFVISSNGVVYLDRLSGA